MKAKHLLCFLLLIACASLGAEEFHIVSRLGGGTVIGCTHPIKEASSLKDAADKRNMSKFCRFVRETPDSLEYDCPKLQSRMWILRGKAACLRLKAEQAKAPKADQLFAFFVRGKKVWGDCAPVIGFQGVSGVTSMLAKPCGRPTRSDGKTYAWFRCKEHGDRSEYYFSNPQTCARVMQTARKKLSGP